MRIDRHGEFYSHVLQSAVTDVSLFKSGCTAVTLRSTDFQFLKGLHCNFFTTASGLRQRYLYVGHNPGDGALVTQLIWQHCPGPSLSMYSMLQVSRMGSSITCYHHFRLRRCVQFGHVRATGKICLLYPKPCKEAYRKWTSLPILDVKM